MRPHLARLLAASIAASLALPVAAQSRTVTPLPHAEPAAVGMSAERLGRLTETLDAYVEDGVLPGGVALVLRRGRVAYRHAFGMLDREANTRMPEDAIFRIASQSKALIAVGIMILQERGALLIGDRLDRHLPEFRETTVAEPLDGGGYEVVPAARPITIRHLLTHTAGIGYGHGVASDRWAEAGIQSWYFANRDEPIRETVRRMAALPMDAHPGERFVYGYSNDILGAVIEEVSGQPLDRFLDEHVLAPCGMHDTHFYLPTEKRDRLTTVYSLRNGTLERAPDEGTTESQGAYVAGPRRSFSGGAGLLSTADDYARFLGMLLNDGRANGHQVLAPSTIDLMTADHLDGIDFPWGPGVGIGLGFRVVLDLGRFAQPGAPGEFGWGGAYHSVYWADPVHDLAVVYFTQVIPANGLDDHAKLRALVYQAIID